MRAAGQLVGRVLLELREMVEPGFASGVLAESLGISMAVDIARHFGLQRYNDDASEGRAERRHGRDEGCCAEIKLMNSRAAPGFPAGSCRKNDSVV